MLLQIFCFSPPLGVLTWTPSFFVGKSLKNLLATDERRHTQIMFDAVIARESPMAIQLKQKAQHKITQTTGLPRYARSDGELSLRGLQPVAIQS